MSSSSLIKANQVRVAPFVFVVPAPENARSAAPFSALPGDLADPSIAIASHEAATRLLQEARQKADQIIREAEGRAQALLAQARERGYAEGRREGWEQGREEGRAAGQAEWSEALAVAQRLIEAAHTYREQTMRATESQIVALALHIAEKIIGDALAHQPELVQRVVTNALAHVLPNEDLHIRLHPRDAQAIQAAWAAAPPPAMAGHRWEVLPDPDLQPGDVIIELPNGSVDARLQTQLEHIRAALEAAGAPPDDGRRTTEQGD